MQHVTHTNQSQQYARGHKSNLWRATDALEHVGLPEGPDNCFFQNPLGIFKPSNVIPTVRHEPAGVRVMDHGIAIVFDEQNGRQETDLMPGEFETTSFCSISASIKSLPENMS